MVLSGLGIASAIYTASVFLVLRVPWIEHHAVYMHRLQLIGRKDLNHPGQFGFAHRQVTPFFIGTKDGIKLHVWHILPIALHYKNATRLVTQGRSGGDFSKTLNFQLLRDDPEARLVIHTHGSSGALAAYCRTECYRVLSSIAPSKIHVLAFDYRGFGLSSGSPTEQGLLVDAQAVFQWATEVAGIPAQRIVLFGQSMGSGVAIALTRCIAVQKIPIGGLIITGTFTDVPTMLSEYRTFLGLRVFGPFAKFPSLMTICTRGMRNKWPNRDRLVEIVRHSPSYHIQIFHTDDDPIVPWSQSNVLFESTIIAASEVKMNRDEFKKGKAERKVEIDEGGWYVEWSTSRGLIRQEVPRYGGHDRIMSHNQIAMAVMRAFQSREPIFKEE